MRNILFAGDEVKSGHILVTGCDTGFGHDAALALNERNIFVFAGCLTADSVEKFNGNSNFKGLAFIMDITKSEDIENAKAIVEAKVGDEGLWCLINNAGIYTPGFIEWLSEKDMRHTMDVNHWGAVNTTKAMIPLIKKGRGRIVITTSMLGRVSLPTLASYAMSKYALEAFSDALRHEMYHFGVSVHIIEPGAHGTNLYATFEKTWNSLWDRQPEDIREQYGENYAKEVLKVSTDSQRMLSANPKNIVKAYLHAALSSQPKLRYIVGIDANTFFMALATLPTAIGDWLFACGFKSTLPAGATKD